MKELNASKTMDLMHKESGQVIMLTGRGFLLEGKHAITLETEGDYIGSEDVHSPIEGDLFSNSICISIGAIHRNFEFVDRVRDNDFISNLNRESVTQMRDAISTFLNNNNSTLSRKLRVLNMDGGVTSVNLRKKEHGLFDLADSAVLCKNEVQVVKRIRIGFDMLCDLNSDKSLNDEFFRTLDEEMLELGCEYYTFERPDGGSILNRYTEYLNFVEIRAHGLAKEK